MSVRADPASTTRFRRVHVVARGVGRRPGDDLYSVRETNVARDGGVGRVHGVVLHRTQDELCLTCVPVVLWTPDLSERKTLDKA